MTQRAISVALRPGVARVESAVLGSRHRWDRHRPWPSLGELIPPRKLGLHRLDKRRRAGRTMAEAVGLAFLILIGGWLLLVALLILGGS
jgi:hypothetical protein